MGLAQTDRSERVPLEQHGAALHVDLLDDVVLHEPVSAATELRQVPRNDHVAHDQCGPVARQQELVRIQVVAVGGAHGRDGAVGRVDDATDPGAAVGRHPTLPPGQHRPAAVALGTEVEGLLVAVERVEPDQVAGLVDDHRPLGGRAALGSDEDAAGRRAP